ASAQTSSISYSGASHSFTIATPSLLRFSWFPADLGPAGWRTPAAARTRSAAGVQALPLLAERLLADHAEDALDHVLLEVVGTVEVTGPVAGVVTQRGHPRLAAVVVVAPRHRVVPGVAGVRAAADRAERVGVDL